MRIIQVVNVRWYNATAWYGLSLAKLLEKAGHQVRVIALPGTETFSKAKELIPNSLIGLYANSKNPCRTIRNLCFIKNLISEFRPHVVNCHRGEGMLFWGLLKARGGGFALVRTRGDQRPPKSNPANRYLYSRMADAVIATNSRTEKQCASFLAVPRARLRMIPGGVDRSFFAADPRGRAQVRSKYGFAEDDMVIGILGRFDPVKGHRELLDAVARIRRRARQGGAQSAVRLMLMGFPANISLEEMNSMIRERGLDECTVVTDKVEDVPAHISAMDVGVVASVGSEAIARAAFEIMSCGVPLLGTDVGVMPDLLDADALVPPGDGAALAFALQRVLWDSDFRRQLAASQAARMVFFSQESFLEQTLAAYADAVGRAGLAASARSF